jgi:hypothetical protein
MLALVKDSKGRQSNMPGLAILIWDARLEVVPFVSLMKFVLESENETNP